MTRESPTVYGGELSTNSNQPGILFIGVNDDGTCANLTITDDLLLSLSSIKPDYPIAALRQLVSNAILHRSYEATNAPIKVYWFKDRIEIYNPGGLFGQVNRENLGQGVTDYRNPHLAEAMKNLGYVQRFGIGIPTARQELAKNGNPPPEFVIDDAYTLVIVRSAL
nr:ATP-binding protein [Spirulina subsalsa]